MPLLQRLSKRVGCRIWDAIKAKLKELTEKEKIDKTLVDYVFVLFDPSNDPPMLRNKLKDFLGDKTDPFVEWFCKVVSQVDNQVSKVQSAADQAAKEGAAPVIQQKPTEAEKDSATDVCLDGILHQQQQQQQQKLQRGSGIRQDNGFQAAEIEQEKKTDASSRRSSRRRDKDASRERHKEQTEELGGVSRMLTKAARDAVKSVQSVGSSHHSQTSPTRKPHSTESQPRVAPAAVATPVAMELEPVHPEEPQPVTPATAVNDDKELSTAGSESKNDVLTIEVDAEDEAAFIADETGGSEKQQPVDTQKISVVTSSFGQKRTYEEAMAEQTHQYNSLTVPAKPSLSSQHLQMEDAGEENIPVFNGDGSDGNDIPGLLVVMPAQSQDHLSRIIVGDEHLWKNNYNNGNYNNNNNNRFNSHPGNRLLFPPPPRHGQPFFYPNNMSLPYPPRREAPFSNRNDFGRDAPFNQHSPMIGANNKRFRAAAPTINPATILCRYLPRCLKKSEACPFYHPACRNGKFCRYGETCVYDHSGAPPPPGFENVGKPLATKVAICTYFPFCTQPSCKFLHKQSVACSFGPLCRLGAQRCGFLHPEDLLPSAQVDNSDLQIADYDDDSELTEDQESVTY